MVSKGTPRLARQPRESGDLELSACEQSDVGMPRYRTNAALGGNRPPSMEVAVSCQGGLSRVHVCPNHRARQPPLGASPPAAADRPRGHDRDRHRSAGRRGRTPRQRRRPTTTGLRRVDRRRHRARSRRRRTASEPAVVLLQPQPGRPQHHPVVVLHGHGHDYGHREGALHVAGVARLLQRPRRPRPVRRVQPRPLRPHAPTPRSSATARPSAATRLPRLPRTEASPPST